MTAFRVHLDSFLISSSSYLSPSSLLNHQGFPVDLVVKNLPASQEMQIRSLGQEDPLEKEVVAHSSIPAWIIPRTEEPGGLQSFGSQESDTTQLSN